MKTVIKLLLGIVGAALILAVLLIALLTVTEFRPQEVSDAPSVNARDENARFPDETVTLISWNVGYGGLGKEADFFMDGGDSVRQTKELTEKYISGISELLQSETADIFLLQEVDSGSKRSYGFDETELFRTAAGTGSAYAINYKCLYVPYPLPTIGKVQSGLLTLTDFVREKDERLSLPCPFSWPLRAANLKRCLLASYYRLENSDKQLVVVNLHLEAYDSGEGKAAQTAMLKEFLQSEYDKGNYVIAGGDFNQCFPGTTEAYPNTHSELWTPGFLEESVLPEGWRYCYDDSAPTCRLLNQAYDPADTEGTQLYVIDGYILSPNVEDLSVETLDLGFEVSDHNPVKLTVRLK